LIPNGADEREFKTIHTRGVDKIKAKLGISPQHKLIVTIGSHTGTKGHSECLSIIDALPRNNTTLVIIGNMKKGCYKSCTRSALLHSIKGIFTKKHTVIADLSRKDTVTLLKAADLFLFLSNIECSPLVLFEAGAAGTPVISADVGNAKEILHWTHGGFTAPTHMGEDGLSYVNISKTVALVENGLTDPLFKKTYGEAARKEVMKHHTWEVITRKYLTLYQNL
jgi:L-malate glycosyltransferase